MTQAITTVIIDADDEEKVVSVVESIDEPGVYGIVILAPDGSSI